MKTRLVIVILFSLSCLTSLAQLNESDTAKFQWRTSLTGNYQQGNVNVLTVRSRLEFSYSPVRDVVFKSQNSSLYQSFSSVKADNDIFSRNYIYWKPQKRVYPFGIFYLSANYRRKIDTRLFAGAGLTLQLLNKTLFVLKVSASTVYEETRFSRSSYNYSVYNGKAKISLWRGTLYTGGWNYLFHKHLRFYYDAYWQPAFNNSNNFRTQLDAGLDFLVWKGLSFNALYTYAHENVVASGVKQDDTILTFGLAYFLKIKHSSKQ